MELLNDKLTRKIKSDIVDRLSQGDYDSSISNISSVLGQLYDNIPDNKRISYGIVHTIKILSEHLYTRLVDAHAPVLRIAADIFDRSSDPNVKGVALGMLSYYGLGDYKAVLPYFESAAASSDWGLREHTQMFFRKLIKKYPNEMKTYLLRLTKSKDANLRRFVAETLRPVQENRGFYKEPEYPLSILRSMFRESAEYPRTAVGNNLSDLARHLPGMVYDLVAELVDSGDKNSYWIAYRACRNLVKTDPIRVLDLLKTNEYKYKDRVYKRSDYQRN
jgi:3-methyladenine DNA glycosylase AlkC